MSVYLPCCFLHPSLWKAVAVVLQNGKSAVELFGPVCGRSSREVLGGIEWLPVMCGCAIASGWSCAFRSPAMIVGVELLPCSISVDSCSQ